MKTNKEIRLENLNKLILLADQNESELARQCDLASNQINQIRNGSKGMGDAIARRIEQNLGLERGWMDNDENPEPELSMLQKMFNTLDERDQTYILDLLKTMYKYKSK